MKASNRDMSERYFLEKKQEIYDTFKAETEQVIKDREMMAGCRAQWMLMVAVAVEFGFGKKRMRRILNRMDKMLPGLVEDRSAEVMDEMLVNDLERIGLNIRETHREYWEAQERLKSFGKFIDKKKERAEAEARERKLLASINKHGFVFGKGLKNV